MRCHHPSGLHEFEIDVEPLQLSEVRRGRETVYQVFRLRMTLNGHELFEADPAPRCLDGVEMWLSQRFDRSAKILTCSCGVLECAGFEERMSTSRKGGVLTWRFPTDYFAYLKDRGVVSGRPRIVEVSLDAVKFNLQLERALNVVREFEKASGAFSGFEAGSYTAYTRSIDAQLARAYQHQLKVSKAARYARHQGTAAGHCAGRRNTDKR